jgi:uncharacterized protein UPF0175
MCPKQSFRGLASRGFVLGTLHVAGSSESRKEVAMAARALTIPYPEELLLSLKESHEEFETEARLLLAVKLYELGRVSTGKAAELAGMNRVDFIFALDRFGLSPVGVAPHELAQDLANA